MPDPPRSELKRALAGRSRRDAKIEVRGLDFYYGKAQALKHVNLDVPANAVTAIIGPSGCGKSTLLRIINRIYELYPEQHATGEVLHRRREHARSDAIRCRTCAARSAWCSRSRCRSRSSIHENVAFALALSRAAVESRDRRPRRGRAAPGRAVGRGQGQAQARALSLSGGQQQRLCIARAHRGAARSAPARRADLGARPDLDRPRSNS